MGLREGQRALAARAHGGDHPRVGDLHAGGPQRRVPRQRRRRQGVEGKLPRVQEEGGQMRQTVARRSHLKGATLDKLIVCVTVCER